MTERRVAFEMAPNDDSGRSTLESYHVISRRTPQAGIVGILSLRARQRVDQHEEGGERNTTKLITPDAALISGWVAIENAQRRYTTMQFALAQMVGLLTALDNSVVTVLPENAPDPAHEATERAMLLPLAVGFFAVHLSELGSARFGAHRSYEPDVRSRLYANTKQRESYGLAELSTRNGLIHP